MNLKNVHENTVSENSSSESNQVDSFNEQQIQNKEKFKCHVLCVMKNLDNINLKYIFQLLMMLSQMKLIIVSFVIKVINI